MMKIVCILCVVVVLAHVARAFPEGAPTDTCSNMKQGHGSKLSGNQGFSIQASASNYTNGATAAPIQVTLQGGSFQGFLLQARQAGKSTNVGTFSSPADTKTIKCSHTDGALTHSRQTSRTSVTTLWTPPSSAQGNIEFVATVGISEDEYVMDVKSPVISGPIDDTSAAHTTSGWTFAVIVTPMILSLIIH